MFLYQKLLGACGVASGRLWIRVQRRGRVCANHHFNHSSTGLSISVYLRKMCQEECLSVQGEWDQMFGLLSLQGGLQESSEIDCDIG